MKIAFILLSLVSIPTFAQSDYYENRYSGRSTQITPSQQAGFNTVNGYYYRSANNTYYKGKNINRDAFAQPNSQGSLSFSYDKNRYAPTNLFINR